MSIKSAGRPILLGTLLTIAFGGVSTAGANAANAASQTTPLVPSSTAGQAQRTLSIEPGPWHRSSSFYGAMGPVKGFPTYRGSLDLLTHRTKSNFVKDARYLVADLFGIQGWWVDFDAKDMRTGEVYYHSQGSPQPTTRNAHGTRSVNWSIRPNSKVCATLFRYSTKPAAGADMIVQSCQSF